jgi:putative iron-dependent peroxidase
MMSINTQTNILADVPRLARYLLFSVKANTNPLQSLQQLVDTTNCDDLVLGLGQPLLKALGKNIDGMKDFPSYSGPGFDVPSTPTALWIWLVGSDRGVLLHQSLEIQQLLSDDFELQNVIDAFQYKDSRDLSGYVDGTENPQGDAAFAAAIVQNQGDGLDGSSFVAVQQWVHDLAHFKSLPVVEQDNIIGRFINDNEEIEDAPASAHVKRTAQEDFTPEAFVVRRSMPWADANRSGLVFVAFGHSVEAFEALLKRMVGQDDGIVDGLFSFTQPISGSYFWCPPIKEGQINLSFLKG